MGEQPRVQRGVVLVQRGGERCVERADAGRVDGEEGEELETVCAEDGVGKAPEDEERVVAGVQHWR